MQNSSILVIGYGNMGRPIVDAAISLGMRPHLLLNQDEEAIEIASAKGLDYTVDNISSDKNFDYILLAIKPQTLEDVSDVISKILSNSQNKKAIVISILAGIKIKSLRKYFAHNPIARLMPNLAITVRKSFTTIITDKFDKTMKHNIGEFAESFGDYTFVDDEKILDLMTSIAGSGPAYFAYFLQEIANATEKLGMPAELAKTAALKTALGTATLLLEKSISPADLIKKVSSKGGVTESGIKTLDESDFSAILENCIKNTYEKAIELAKLI